jgi:hypothetical protein
MSKNTNLSFLTDYITADITNGRIGINNASPTYAFDVTGLERSRGTTASDTAPLGSELAGVTGTGTNWALASGATNLNVGGYTHTVGSTTALTTSLAAVIGTYYQITYTITGRTAGSITIAYGGTSTGASASGASGPLASSTAVLTITPTTDFDGTVVLSIKSIGTSSASSTFANSSGTSTIEFRASSIASNTFIGNNAGVKNTTGNNNLFFGTNAGYSNTTGYYNYFSGTSAGQNNTTGGDNAFIGANAGYNNTTGSQNIFFGSASAFNLTSGNYNIFLGRNAGRTIANGAAATSIENSLIIGNDASPLSNGQTNQIVIGNGAKGLGSNTTVLGNSSTATTAIYGNLLLGSTVDAGYKLDVTGTARVSGVSTFTTTSASTSVFNSTDTNGGFITFQRSGTAYGYIGSAYHLLTPAGANTDLAVSANGAFIVGTGASLIPRLTITSAGNVEIKNQLTLTSYFNLIGTSSSANRYAYIYTTDSILSIYAASGGGEVKDLELRSSASATGGNITLKTNGNTLIGTYTDNGYKLNVNGQPGANGYTLWTNYSDKRLKENIQPLVNNTILDKINLLNPVTFNYNEASGYDKETRARKVSGFIAQELQEIFPEMVGTLKLNDEEYYDTNLSNLSLYLVKAIQELSAEINLLKQK